METYYLIDFENVHDEGLANIDSLSKNDHVHIFYTNNALKINMDILSKGHDKGIDITIIPIPTGKQSLDMHLVSYLGYLLGNYGKQYAYVIVSKDTDYDNIIKFWQEEGYPNISRKPAIPAAVNLQKKVTQQTSTAVQTVNSKINAGMDYVFTGDDRSELNLFMQHGLAEMSYLPDDVNRICKYVVAHCNDERMLSGIHNDLTNDFDDYSEVYEDVKTILGKFASSKSKVAKRESQVRSFFGQHFRKKLYVDKKEEIISLLLDAETKQQVNNGLLKLYSDGKVVRHIYQTVQPLMKDLPGE